MHFTYRENKMANSCFKKPINNASAERSVRKSTGKIGVNSSRAIKVLVCAPLSGALRSGAARIADFTTNRRRSEFGALAGSLRRATAKAALLFGPLLQSSATHPILPAPQFGGNLG